jgi:lysophospholipase L1-like esterase
LTHRRPVTATGRAILVVATIALVAGACSSGPSRPPVAVIGDSVTFLASGEIQAGADQAGYRLLITGRIGFTAAQLAPDVTRFARQHPSVVLFELGTNDVTQSVTGATSAAAYERVMDSYRTRFGDACLIATTVSSHRAIPIMDRTAQAINAWLHAHFTHVVEWDDYEWAQRQAGHVLVEPDEVHPNDAGQQALANLDLAAIKSCQKA